MAVQKTVYTGPLRKNLALYPCKIFTGPLPQDVQAAMEASPAFAHLFVPFEKFVKGRPPGAPSLKQKKVVPPPQATPIRRK
jgi:hypothetical protein